MIYLSASPFAFTQPGSLRGEKTVLAQRVQAEFLHAWADLGTRLLPVFDSPTGIPYKFVNLQTGKVQGPETSSADAGTLLIELGALSRLTRQPVFYDRAKRAVVEIYKRRSPIGLVGQRISVETGEVIFTTEAHPITKTW